MFGAEVLIFILFCLLPGILNRQPQPGCNRWLQPTVDFREAIKFSNDLRAQRCRVAAELSDNLRDDATILLQQSRQQMLGIYLGMVVFLGDFVRPPQRLSGFVGKAIYLHCHRRSSSCAGWVQADHPLWMTLV